MEFKLWDKVSALVKLGQHLGLFATKVEHTGKRGDYIPIKIIEVVRPAPKRPDHDGPGLQERPYVLPGPS